MATTKLGKTIGPIIRGDTHQVNCTFLQSDGSTAVQLAGGTAYFTVQSSDNPPDDTTDLKIQKTTTSFTSPTTGQHTFTLSHTDTNIDPGTYDYDAQFVDGIGNYLSSYRGKFIIQSDVTRT